MRPLGTVLCLCLLSCAPARGESMAEAVEAALKRFPDFRAAQANRRATHEQVGQARGAYFPSADLTLGTGRERTNSPGTRAFTSDANLDRREAELTVTQLLFDWGATHHQVRRFEERADGANSQVANVAENVALRTALAYLEVLRLRGQVVLAADNVSAHERTVSQVGALVERGAGRRSDLQQATGRLALAQNVLTQTRGQLAQSEAAYRHIVGQAPGALRAPEGLSDRLPDDIDRVVSETVRMHPAVLAAEREHSAAQADRDSARGRLARRLNLEAGVGRNHD